MKPLRPLKVAEAKIADITRGEFKTLQEGDTTLHRLRERAEEGRSDRLSAWGAELYYIDEENGLLYRQFTSPVEKRPWYIDN